MHIGIEEICPESEREKRVVEEVVCVWAGEVVTSVGTDGEAAMQKLLPYHQGDKEHTGQCWQHMVLETLSVAVIADKD